MFAGHAICLLAICWIDGHQDVKAGSPEGATPPSYVIDDYLRAPGHAALDRNDPTTIVHYELHDANGDGHPDWILYQTGLCGSGRGCEADLYIFKDGKFCYAGTDVLEAFENIHETKLKCLPRPG